MSIHEECRSHGRMSGSVLFWALTVQVDCREVMKEASPLPTLPPKSGAVPESLLSPSRILLLCLFSYVSIPPRITPFPMAISFESFSRLKFLMLMFQPTGECYWLGVSKIIYHQ